MNTLFLLCIVLPIALLVIFWLSRWIEDFGDGIGLLCILAATPSILAHDRIMDVVTFTWKFLPHLHERKEGKLQPVTLHDLVYLLVGDIVAGLVGVVILAGDAQIAYVFNPSLFGTHEVAFSSNIFEWGASLLWVAVPAMFGIVAFDCLGIVKKSSGMFGERRVIRVILGILFGALMGLAIFLVMYAYSYRGVKIFDTLNKDALQQMGESILPLLGLLIAAASFPALLAVGKGIATVLTLLLCLLLGVLWFIAELLYSPARFLNIYALFCTGGQRGVFIKVQTQETVDAVPVILGKHAISQTVTPPPHPAPSAAQFAIAAPAPPQTQSSLPFTLAEVRVPEVSGFAQNNGMNGSGATQQKKA